MNKFIAATKHLLPAVHAHRGFGSTQFHVIVGLHSHYMNL